jgi:diadenosine tetraphosphate (Ap4A) HIT family hydrolase
VTQDAAPCALCSNVGGELLWSDSRCRIVQVVDVDFPGYCRVIWNAHVAEMTDLEAAERIHLMSIVCILESAIREITHADKINLASFGNVVPHLHWHVIPRWRDDAFFPNPVWGERLRDGRSRQFDQSTLRRFISKAISDVR